MKINFLFSPEDVLFIAAYWVDITNIVAIYIIAKKIINFAVKETSKPHQPLGSPKYYQQILEATEI